MTAAMKLAYKRDINDPLVTFCPETLLMRGDKGANIIELTVMDGSSPADLSGHTAVVMFQRPGDSDKIRCPGSISGNVISVTLLGDCYAYAGQYYASVILTADGFTRTMLRLAGHVENSGDGPVIDPTGTIPGYDDIARIYAELEASLEKSETATNSANAAAQNANTAAGSANASAGAANTAAGKANDATSRANTAAASIEGLTVEASDVSYNQPATATVTDVEGHKHIAFGLRQGVPGPVPKLTFTGETGEPNTDVVITQSGPPEAPVVNLKIPQGVPGTGNVSSVDGVVSDTGGNVNLSAVRYMAQTLEDEQKVQARQNIGVDGQVYTCTAQALEDMSQEQQAELYVQGYRAIKTENNGTVVLMGLAADGSLEWLGCNQPRGNLLDNSDFAIAQAGYGGMHGTATYVADRWKNLYPQYGAASISDGALIISGTDCYVGQALENANELNGRWITFAANVDGVDVAGSLQLDTTQAYQLFVNMEPNLYLQTVGSAFCIRSGADTQKTVKNIRVLYGSYTPKTLPPFEAPKYTSELLECLRYYTQEDIYFTFSDSSNLFDFFVPFKIQMRIVPTSVVFSVSNGTAGYIDYFDGSQWAQSAAQIETYQNGVRVFGSTGSAHQVVRFKMASSADL